MFSKVDHISGAFMVRLRRLILNTLNIADISILNNNISIGGSSQIKLLVKNNVDAILDLREEASDNELELKKYSINYLRIKIKDRNVPDTNDVMKAIQWVESKVVIDNKIFIHCNLGRGRATLFACLYLIHKGHTPESAIDFVKKRRSSMYLNSRQIHYLAEFFKNFQKPT